MKPLVVVLSLALLAALAHIGLTLRPKPIVVAAREAPVSAAERASVVSAAPAPAADVRREVRRAVAEKRPQLVTVRDVDGYLDELRAHARRKHQVTALEVEPGIAAIRRLYPPGEAIRRMQEFTSEMAQLSAELDGRALTN